MALADRLQPDEPDRCSVGRLLANLDGAELAAFKVMLGTPDNWGWNAPEIYEALKAEGHAVGFKAINKHRGGNCRCTSDCAHKFIKWDYHTDKCGKCGLLAGATTGQA